MIDMSCYCQETEWKPCPGCEVNKNIWPLIPNNERVVLIAYKRALVKNLKVPRKMIIEVNNIIFKYEELSVADIP